MGCGLSKNHEKLFEIGQKFINNPSVRNIFNEGGASDLVLKKYIQMFGFKPSEHIVFDVKQSDINKFKGELKHILKQIKKGKIINNLGSSVYTTSAVVRRNPALGTLYDNFLKTQYNLKGRQSIDVEQFNNMMTHLSEAGVIEGLLPSTKSIKKAQKLATKYQQEIESLRIDANNGKDVDIKLQQAEVKLDNFLSEGEGIVFKKFIEKIESKTKGIRSLKEIQEIEKNRDRSKKLTDNQLKIIRDSIHNSGIAETPQMANALTEYVMLMNRGYHTLNKGVEAYISAVKEGMVAKGITNTEKLDQVSKKLRDKILPDQKIGYYPHYRYDLNAEFLDGLMPKLQKLSIESSFGIESRQNIESLAEPKDLIEAALSDINTYLSKRIKPRTKDLDSKLYSMNFPVTIKRYLDEINRFNFVAHTQKYTRQVLNEAMKGYKKGKDLEGYGRQFTEMVMDLQQAQTGIKDIKAGEWNNLSRGLLNLEFASKLGFNLRSGIVNSTQYLLNLVEFGPIIKNKAANWYKGDFKMEKYVLESMRESGLRFKSDNPELLDMQSSKAFSQNVKLNDGGEIVFTKPSKLSKFADMTGSLAGKSGYFMRVAENFNRESTYKIGFYKMWKTLESNARYKDMMNKKFNGKMSQKQWEAELKKRSKNYAQNMVNLLHFDYSSVSKSKLLRSPVGRFMFQFQHYAHKFLEYNLKVARDAKSSILSGDFSMSGDAGKAYRMGMTYFLVPYLIGALFERDAFRLIQHDTASRVQQWWKFFTGDEDEFKEATYGRGAIGALVGFPLLSDALTTGELLELWELDDDSYRSLLIGYNDQSALSGDQKYAKAAGVISPALKRYLYTTSDLAFSGYLSEAIMQEMNFYRSTKSKESKELLTNAFRNNAPDKVLEVLDSIQDSIEGGRRKSTSSKKKPKDSYFLGY
tara:strand:- start:1438 stop:4194 length:2757 start_codon:yes stop_codon:yes gene_type:complete